MENRTEEPDRNTVWANLLDDAIRIPGTISRAYRNFWGYSMGNALLATWQCKARKIPIGPLASYGKWQELGRQVKRGEKALTLCMPITWRKPTDIEGEEDELVTYFTFRRRWFVLAQTEGQEYQPNIPKWDKNKAMTNLGIRQTAFADIDGNTLGYATNREIAINPVNPMPEKTLMHEIAHVVLGHTDKARLNETATMTRNERELEAEATALLVGESLGLGYANECRGYIQHWYGNRKIENKTAQRIITAADKILKAGQN